MGKIEELRNRKETLRRLADSARQKREEVIQLVQTLVSQLNSGKITRLEYNDRLFDSLKLKKPEEWIKYYDDYINNCNEKIRACDELIYEEKSFGRRETRVKALKFFILLVFIGIIISVLFSLYPLINEAVNKISLDKTNLSEKASEEIEKMQVWQQMIVKERGVEKKTFPEREGTEVLEAAWSEGMVSKLSAQNGILDKKDLGMLKADWMKMALEKFPEMKPGAIDAFYEEKMDAHVHDLAIKEGKRVDGRGFDEIRKLEAQAGGVSPVIHGSGIFYRGETHVLAALTLGGPGDAQLLDTIESQDVKKTFMLHYNFPPFSVGETGRFGGMNRRMIGHGALAEKSVRVVLPTKGQFPYTIRIVSECLASNGSTSMATVCASTLALMDAGVPIKRPVAGIAMGMMSDGKSYKVLTDIQGPEDHHGDMDFKVAGTSEGVTGVQMDVKVNGVPLKVLSEAFAQAKKARLEILEVITKEISAPRADISPRAPKILSTKVKVEQIGLVIGPGGKMINGIRDRSGCDDITIDDDGSVFVTGRNGAAEAALKEIIDLTREYIAGERLEGPVVRMLDFGAFVKIGPNTDGLVHVSEVAPFRIGKISDAVEIGEIVPVMIKEIDEKGRYNLSIKAADPEWAARKGLKPSEGGEGHHERRDNQERHGGRRHRI